MASGTGDTRMDASEYLSRIGYRGATEPSLDNLKAIHRQHLLAVPFGSLAIHCGERIELALPAVYQKVVVQRRGGFCYELNGLFSWLLQALGYQVQLVSGRVRNAITQQPGPPKDHLLLLVATAGEGGHRRWLCDVGFGNAFRWPLPLEDGHLERQENGLFHLQLAGGEGDWRLRRYPLSCQGPTDEPSATLYLFSTEPRAWCDFGAMCRYHQISTSSIFVCKSFCSLHLPGGLVTYMGHRLIETEFNADGDRKATRELTDEEIPQVLKERFGIVLTNRLIPKDEDILPPEEGP